jgi:hypothetical protein
MDPVPFLDPILTFPDGASYERLEPITDFRQCHGVTPPERRILFRCRRFASSEDQASSSQVNPSNGNKLDKEAEEHILKIKVQIPDDSSNAPNTNQSTTATPSEATTTTSTLSPPSIPTAHELKALAVFRDSQTPSGPHLVAFSHAPQNSAGPLPGEGYISSTVMSKIGGKSLFEIGYWSMTSEEREEIQRGFLGALG